jgi:hypothetical protein
MKRFVLAFIAAYIFLFLWGWLLNGIFLKDIYAETPTLWRPQSEMMSLFHWIIIGQALIVFAFVMIYASGFTGGGGDCGNSARCSIGSRCDWNASGFLRRAADPGKVDLLRQCRRYDRDDHRRCDGGRDLQAFSCAGTLEFKIRQQALDVERWALDVR